jgi:hypothetical protein
MGICKKIRITFNKGLMIPKGKGVKDPRPALSRRGDYLKYRLSVIIMMVY